MSESFVIVITFLSLIVLLDVLALKYGLDSRRMDARPNL